MTDLTTSTPAPHSRRKKSVRNLSPAEAEARAKALEEARERARLGNASRDANDYKATFDQSEEKHDRRRREKTLQDAKEIQYWIRLFRAAFYRPNPDFESAARYMRELDPRLQRHLRAHISKNLPDRGWEVHKIAYDIVIDRMLIPKEGPGDLLETHFLLAARNIIIDAIRKYFVHNRPATDDLSDLPVSPEDHRSSWNDPENSKTLDEMLELAPKYRDGEAYLMRMEGCSIEYIAHALDITKQSAQNYISSYANKIRERLLK